MNSKVHLADVILIQLKVLFYCKQDFAKCKKFSQQRLSSQKINTQLFVKTNLYDHGSIQIQTIGVKTCYDVSCTTPISNVDGGPLMPGLSKTNLIYVKN